MMTRCVAEAWEVLICPAGWILRLRVINKRLETFVLTTALKDWKTQGVPVNGEDPSETEDDSNSNSDSSPDEVRPTPLGTHPTRPESWKGKAAKYT